MRTSRRVLISLSLVVSLGLLISVMLAGDSAQAAEQRIKLKVLSSWGTEYIYTREFLVPFVDKLNKTGRIELSWVGPEAVPSFEQLKPVSGGIFDFLYSHPAYHMGEVAIGVGMDLIKGTAKERREAGFYQVLDEGYKKANVKVVALVGGVGYTFQMKKELTKADLTGMKLRASPSYDPLIKALGGVSVRMPPGETYSALEKGVVDGAAGPVWNALDWKWGEVAKFQVLPTYGEVVDWLWVNQNSWGKLPKDVQDLITQVAMETEEEGRKNVIGKWKDAEAGLLQAGMKLNTLPGPEGEKLIKAYYDRSWEEIVLKYAPDVGPKLKKIADEFVKTHKQD